MRLAILSLSLCLALSTCSPRAAERCADTWTRQTFQDAFTPATGVNIHFTDPQPGEVKMIAEAGFRWVRMDFKWDATEYERGHYDFSAYDRLMTELKAHGIRAFFILDYGNPLYDNGAPPRTEAAQQAFVLWSVAAAKHFAGRGVLWEIYNEPNHQLFWPPRPNVNEYVALALAVGRAWRVEVPNEKLIGPATSGLEFSFLEACFKAGLLEYWSAVSVHPYRETNPEIVAEEYCLLRQTIARYRQPKDSGLPIVSGEWGYSSVWRGMNEQIQGELLARQFLTNVANGIPISIWYDWRDDGPNPREPEHHFGLVRNSYHPGRAPIYDLKPAYVAAKTLNAFLDGYSFERRIAVGSDNDYVLLFSRGGESRIAAWTSLPVTHRVAVPGITGSFAAIRYSSEALPAQISNQQGLTLELSSAPIYLTSRR